jgi:Tfp pilus assembly protein PilZ
MPERASARFVPRRSVTVAFEGPDNPTAYGVVANISEGGACVWTDARLEVGQHLTLELSFAREPRPVPAQGRVVWIAPVTGTPGRRCGVQWNASPGPEGQLLRQMIAASS